MANKKMNARDAQSPIKGQFPDGNKIACKNCKHRDKSVINLGSKEIKVGVTKAYCDVFKAPPESNGKPHEVLFENGICEYHEEEE